MKVGDMVRHKGRKPPLIYSGVGIVVAINGQLSQVLWTGLPMAHSIWHVNLVVINENR